MLDVLKPLLGKLCNFSQERMGFSHPPKLFLKSDLKNSKDTLGKTAYYDPNEKSVTLYVLGRHPKDILRSFAHELVHHTQNERGDLAPEKMTSTGANYAQECPHMRKMEKEAYLRGSMCFRDWEDKYKLTLQESIFLKENKTMTTKITKEFLRETIRKVLNEQMSDEDFVAYAQRNKAAQGTDAYRDAVARIADKKASAKSAQQAAADRVKKQRLADFEARRARERSADAKRKLNKSKVDAQGQIADEMENAIESLEDSVAGGIDYHRRNSSAPSQRIVKKFEQKVAAIKAEKERKRLAIANAGSPEQVAAILDGAEDKTAIAGAPAGGTYPSKGPSALDKLKKAAGAVGSSIKTAGSALGSAVGAASSAEISRLGKQQLRFNKMLGMDMKKLQSIVGAEQTGQYDLQTATAIKNFQTDIGAKPDGVFGGGTYRTAKAKKKLEETMEIEEGHPLCKNGCQCEPISESEELEENEELEEADSNVKMVPKDKVSDEDEVVVPDGPGNLVGIKRESKIQTPEQENTLYENRFAPRNNRLFEKLVKEWTK